MRLYSSYGLLGDSVKQWWWWGENYAVTDPNNSNTEYWNSFCLSSIFIVFPWYHPDECGGGGEQEIYSQRDTYRRSRLDFKFKPDPHLMKQGLLYKYFETWEDEQSRFLFYYQYTSCFSSIPLFIYYCSTTSYQSFSDPVIRVGLNFCYLLKSPLCVDQLINRIMLIFILKTSSTKEWYFFKFKQGNST